LFLNSIFIGKTFKYSMVFSRSVSKSKSLAKKRPQGSAFNSCVEYVCAPVYVCVCVCMCYELVLVHGPINLGQWEKRQN